MGGPDRQKREREKRDRNKRNREEKKAGGEKGRTGVREPGKKGRYRDNMRQKETETEKGPSKKKKKRDTHGEIMQREGERPTELKRDRRHRSTLQSTRSSPSPQAQYLPA